jgi:ribonucleoside-diphosphate reductase alpha chain
LWGRSDGGLFTVMLNMTRCILICLLNCITQRILKRNGLRQVIVPGKVLQRVERLSRGLAMEFVDAVCLTHLVFQGIYDGVISSKLDELSAEVSASLATVHAEYGILAARIAVSSHHKYTIKSSFETSRVLLFNSFSRSGREDHMIDSELIQEFCVDCNRLDSLIYHDRDFNFDYFSFRTMTKSYLLRLQGKVLERPQHLFWRVSMGIHCEDVISSSRTYHMLSQCYFTHATPTLF